MSSTPCPSCGTENKLGWTVCTKCMAFNIPSSAPVIVAMPATVASPVATPVTTAAPVTPPVTATPVVQGKKK